MTPVLQPTYIGKFNHKLKTLFTGKNTVGNLKKKPNESRWMYYMHPYLAKWKKFAQLSETPKEMLQRRKKYLKESIMLPKLSSQNNQNKDASLSPQTDIIKITTIIETIRRKRQINAQISEEANNIQGIIAKKRLKRSSQKTENSSPTKKSRRAQKEKTTFSYKRPSHPERRYQNQRKPVPTKRAADHDLKVASSIPSTVFYKRIWEYINGTRSHSDIMSGYNGLEDKSDKDGSACVDKDGLTASQSQANELQVLSPNITKSEAFYKRIWDMINATRLMYGKKVRSKRNLNALKSNISTAASCVQAKTADKENEQVQSTIENVPVDTVDTAHPRKITDPYLLSFWSVAKKTQWQPKIETPQASITKYSDNPLLLPFLNTASASEVADLNKAQDEDRTSEDSTGYIDKTRESKSLEISEPGPPYHSEEENSAPSAFSSTERATKNASREEDREEQARPYTTDVSPAYDPANIPYVEVPDYSDQKEDSLDRNNRTTAKYQEYDDNDYVDPKRSYSSDESSSETSSIEIKLLPSIQIRSDGQENSLNVNLSHSPYTEKKEPAESNAEYNIADTKSRNYTADDASSDVHHSAENTTKTASSAENEESIEHIEPIRFDINEYKKPLILDDDYVSDDPNLKNVQDASSKENATYDDKGSSDYSDESEEETTYPKQTYADYFTNNKDFRGDDFDVVFDDGDETKKSAESRAVEKAKDSETDNEDHYSHGDKDFLEYIFRDDNVKESSDIDTSMINTEDEFLSRYFTKDVLHHLRDNSTAEEDRKQEETRNRENIQKTLSMILSKKDQFSRLDENLNKMIEEGEAVPIKYNNFWSLEYESPGMKHKEEKEPEERETEEA